MLSVSVLVAGTPAGASSAIRSALAQSLPVHEVLEQVDQDPAEAWRHAYGRSSGDVVLLLNHYDALAAEHCQRLVARLEGSPDLGAAFVAADLDETPHLITTRLLREVNARSSDAPRDEFSAAHELMRAMPLLRRSFIDSTDLLAMRSPFSGAPAAIWSRMSASELKVAAIDRTLLAGEYAMMAMQAVRAQALPAARTRLAMMHAAAESEHVCRQVLLRTALRVVEALDGAELARFIETLHVVLPTRLATHIDALRSAESGFSSFRAGNLSGAVSGMLHAFRGAPQLVANAGTWSVLGKALLGMLGMPGSRDVVQSTVQQVGAALGAAPIGVSDTGLGTHRNTFIVRLPRERVLLRIVLGPQAVQRAERLAALLMRLRSANVRAPGLRAHGRLLRVDSDNDVAWVAEEFIEADVSEPWRMQRSDAVRLAECLGQALRHVHDLSVGSYGPLHSERRIGFAEWLEMNLPYNPEAESHLTHDIRVRLMHARDRLLADEPKAPVMVHSDLWPGNYLFTPNGECVLIDWASALGGDPAYDPAVWHMALRDRDLLDHFLAAYAPSEPAEFRARVNAYADLYAAALLSHHFTSQRIDAARLHAQARQWLERSVHPARAIHAVGVQ